MIKTVFKREIVDILRDKKTIFMTIIIPLILYPTMMFGMMVIMQNVNTTMQAKELTIAFSNPPSTQILNKIEQIEDEGGKLNIIEVSDYEKAIENEEISAYIDITTEDEKPSYKVYINSSIDDNNEASKRIKEVILLYKEDLVNSNIEELGVDKEDLLEPISYEVVDVAEKEQVAGYFLGTILPFMLITGILTGATYPAIDTMAGEKERGTLETLLTLPITNLELVMGKYIAVALITVSNAILSIISILLSIGLMFMTTMESVKLVSEDTVGNFDISRMIVPGITTLVCVIIFSMIIAAVCMCACSVVKSIKEAQNATTPIMLVGMLLSYTSMIPTIELDLTTANIPVVNVVLLIKSVLTFNYDISLMTMVLLSNTIFMMLSIWVLSKLFNSEEVLFGSVKGFSFLESRNNLQKGTMPSVSDGILMYCICVLILLYISSYTTVKFGVVGTVIHQSLFLILPLALSIYVKSDLKKVYSIKIPKVTHILASLLMWVGLFIIMLIVGNIIMSLLPAQQESMGQLEEMLKIPDNIFLNILIVAAVPAICEEFLFRGFIFSSIRGKTDKDRNNNKRVRNAIIISGIMFGIMHMDLTKLITTSILGIGIAYVVYKTGSIFTGILIHFINNAVAVIIMNYPDHRVIKSLENMLVDSNNNLDIMNLVMIIVVGIISMIIGYMLLKGSRKESSEDTGAKI